jgi:DNA-binding CsgD family transcriptional regulator
MPIKKKPTWIGFMNDMSGRGYDPAELKIEGVEKFLDINQHFHSILHHSIPMTYLVDYSSGKYMLMSKSVRMLMGYDPEDFISGGLAFTLENYHKADMKLYNEQIFPDRLDILKKIPPEEHSNYIFSYDFRFKNKKNKYVNLLQRNCFIKSDEKGNPLLSLGMVIDINHYKSNGPVIQVVDKLNGQQPDETLYKKIFYLHEEDRLFTKREKEVLLWTADGLTSKEIAQKLGITESTIINHRKNMLQKAGVRNAAELISFSLRQGII